VQDHFDATGIHTFMIGMNGADYDALENWADYTGAIQHDDTNNACGNSAGPCYHYNVNNGEPSVFIWALQQIQQSVLGCTFTLPDPAQGVLDLDRVSVEYLAGGVPPAQTLTHVADLASCVADGWYYDVYVGGEPTVIQLCPALCATVQSDTNAQVQIKIDCQGS
jgi:hypothetical protein